MASVFQFPKGFLWGAATSAHQVEGNNIHNDWWAWEQAGKVKASSGIACDQYRRFAQDFDLARQLNQTAHRFSIEWARLEPKKDRWDDKALAHYVEVVDALRQRGLEPIATLHHFTTPQWMAEEGSWENPAIAERFARFTKRIAEALASKVRYWITINEPMVFIRMHYVQAIGPPGLMDIRAALRATENLIRAHGLAYHAIHDAAKAAGATAQVSVAKNLPVFVPCKRWSPGDHLMTRLTDQFFNTAFLEAVTIGRWAVPGRRALQISEARSTLDYIGVNFYGRQFIHMAFRKGDWPGHVCGFEHHSREAPELTLMGWDICPDAFTQTLMRAHRLGVPVFVLECGAWIEDARRWPFIHCNLVGVARAIQQGANILGFCYWSLIDNYEWSHGFTPRFGLIEVDYATQMRTIRESARRYAEVCRTNQIDLRNE